MAYKTFVLLNSVCIEEWEWQEVWDERLAVGLVDFKKTIDSKIAYTFLRIDLYGPKAGHVVIMNPVRPIFAMVCVMF
jgi:hypothetical protein